MTANNIIIAHPELLVGQALGQLITASKSQRVGSVVQLSTDMASTRASFFQQQPFPVLASFTKCANWILIADLGGLIAQEVCERSLNFEQTQANKSMGLGVYHLSTTGPINGELVFTQSKWLGDINYATNSVDFIPTLERAMQMIAPSISSACNHTAETRDAAAIKTRVGLQ
ncbi:hypothetical protein [Thiomicrospira cyclica]|uniref:Uncharacterized protein n=1 Tax=Thiomicrospira cyclica (strain DSM 14477 / JCM 11371 / ALM1) TaxID=717773 RepID=F6D8M8_THICA|nr:hypothetical protein [Thiomicrospira cyclica]AEG31879.1 hypothetical protein Thicy_1112 [Thiomicrospira cyclica ALM1]